MSGRARSGSGSKISSTDIWKKKCHSGDPIPKVEVVACRYGGESGDEKIPFLTLIFDYNLVDGLDLLNSYQTAPFPDKTAGIVFNIIQKS